MFLSILKGLCVAASPTFEWKDVALDIKCVSVSNCGVEIENGLYEGESASPLLSHAMIHNDLSIGGFCLNSHGTRIHLVLSL